MTECLLRYTQSVLPQRLVVMLLLGIIWFIGLGYRELAEPDEARYAEIAREMLVSGDWVTPRLNGFKYFEKPPLQYWATAAAFDYLGVSVVNARLWTALLGFAGLLWAGFLGCRLYGLRVGFYAALILASSLLYVVLGHVNTLDMGVSIFLFVAVGALCLAQEPASGRLSQRSWMLLAWSSTAAATLSKGFIGIVLPAGGVVLYSLIWQDWRLWRRLHLVKGLLLFLLLLLPWFWSVSARNLEFPHFFFIHEHVQRYASDVHDRTQPAWFFVVGLMAAVFPWTCTAVRALLLPEHGRDSSLGSFRPERLIWAFVVFTLVFFSLSHSKMVTYLLPVIPAMALLSARLLSENPAWLQYDRVLAGSCAVILLLGAVLWDGVKSRVGLGSFPSECRWWLLMAGTVWLVGAVLSPRVSGSTPPLLVLSLASLLAIQLLIWSYPDFTRLRSTQRLADVTRYYARPGVPVYSLGRYDQALPFYLNRTVTLVLYRGELGFGIDQEPGKWISRFIDFTELWLQAPQAVAIVTNEDYPHIQNAGLPMRRVYQGLRNSVVIRH